MIELLTEQDKENIVSWISHFGPQNDGHTPYNVPNDAMADVDHILRFWDKAKEEHLHKMFGDNLILTRPYTYTLPIHEVQNAICRKVLRGQPFQNIVDFINQCTTKIAQLNNIRFGLWELTDSYTLAMNNCNRVFDGMYMSAETQAFYIDLPDGKKYKVQRNTKPLKVIYKLMDTWGDRMNYYTWRKDYETVRILLSQCTNNAALHGDLCLSIHPLDFMTMSDNDNNWSSCMRWRHNGEYSQGTIEMMNSPTVIVAYLHNPDKPMDLPNGNTWDNKIWRELFVVDDKIVTEVKPYPYDDENLTRTCLEWIMSLMGDTSDWISTEMEGDCDDIVIGQETHTDKGELYERPINICANFSFRNGYMYNDFGTMSRSHFVYVNVRNTMEKYVNGHNIWWDVEYSGTCECIWCGDTNISDDWDDDEETSSYRVCIDCTDDMRCSCCGSRIRGNDYYYDNNGEIVCYNCYNEYYGTDDITGELVHNDQLMCLYLVKNDDPNNPEFTGDYINIANKRIPYWSEYFKTEELHTYMGRWYNKTYICVSECTEKGLALFNYSND